MTARTQVSQSPPQHEPIALDRSLNLTTLARAALSALALRFRTADEPVYRDVALLGSLAAAIANPDLRAMAGVALPALGVRPTRAAVWRFATRHAYERAANAALACQADRLTPAWATKNVLASDLDLPTEGCVLISVHHFHQRLAFARLSSLVKDLGAVGTFEPLPRERLSTPPQLRISLAERRRRARSHYSHAVFGDRLYSSRTAPRAGLDLLKCGGSLIVVPDFAGADIGMVLGRQVTISRAPMWWAQKADCPIVPFVVSPPDAPGQPWRLWCGKPIEPNWQAVATALETCIRLAPTVWTAWRAWSAAPAANLYE
ncbi:MAG: hypothetical protein NVSMB2_19760 [Chloroflexota bacterium]